MVLYGKWADCSLPGGHGYSISFNTCSWMGFRGVQDGYFATTRREQNGGNLGDFESVWSSESERVKLLSFSTTFYFLGSVGWIIAPSLFDCILKP